MEVRERTLEGWWTKRVVQRRTAAAAESVLDWERAWRLRVCCGPDVDRLGHRVGCASSSLPVARRRCPSRAVGGNRPALRLEAMAQHGSLKSKKGEKRPSSASKKKAVSGGVSKKRTHVKGALTKKGMHSL